MNNYISRNIEDAKKLNIDRNSKIILFSDCHRGDGTWSDNFMRNQNIFYSALSYYYAREYTYIELGDGEELWENRRLSDIMKVHSNIYRLFGRFLNENRLYIMWGNHDRIKSDKSYMRQEVKRAVDDTGKKYLKRFADLEYYESIVLQYENNRNNIVLLHGHQEDFLNDKMWRASRWLVRYVWKPLEAYGVNDPTSAGINYKKKEIDERRMSNWAKDSNCMVIAGHTHRAMFPSPGKVPYFNLGSCVHPRCITGIEICGGKITLVKWQVNTRQDGTMYIGRYELVDGKNISEYFNIYK